MRIHFLILGLALSSISMAQINGYAQISAFSGTTLTIGVASEAGAPFLAGKQVVLMQMQDSVIGTNTGNNAAFGNLSSIEQVGRYEVRTIVSVARDAFGAPIGLELDAAPTVLFNTRTNSRLQAITFELLGAGGDFTTTANITARSWNGNIGGVVAFEVQGRLTLQHDITANGAGFRGGERDGTFFSGPPCDGTTFRDNSTGVNTNRYATKGEGIYRLTNTAWADGRGKILTGGGGGNMVNAGGGGGGNFTAGGSAVFGWSCGTTEAGGIGGISLLTNIDADRVYLGGGGGGGEGNDNASTDGANGGGIIFIKAEEIHTSGTCGQRVISANGATAANSGNDGAGGGGAGGSIVVDCNTFDIAASCPLVFLANGGAGGTVNSSTHGGGGGGGQGVIIFSGVAPSTNVTLTTNNGAGGCNNNSSPCNSQANSGSGANGQGVIIRSSGPLPIELLSFQALPVENGVVVSWTTATELNNDHFTVERSPDGHAWEALGQVPGAGTSLQASHYRYTDRWPFSGLSYYRLRQTDTDGTSKEFDRVAVRFDTADDTMVAFPNPAATTVTLVHGTIASAPQVLVCDGMGRVVPVPFRVGDGSTELDVRSLPGGTYVVSITDERRTRRARILVAR